MSRRVSRQPRGAMAGRALPPVPSALRNPDERQARSGAHRQLVPGGQPRHCPARQALPQRGRPAQAASAGLPLGPRRVRRGAQDVGDVLRRRGQVHEALSAGPAPVGPHSPLPPDDRDPAQREGGGLSALHGTSGVRPRGCGGPGRGARERNRGGRAGGARSGDGGPFHRRAEGRDRDAQGARSSRAGGAAQRHRHQVARACQSAR